MFSKKQRLTRKQFDDFSRAGKRHHSDALTLVYTPHTTTSAAVVVGKKVAKKSPKRNELRRRVYGVAYRHLKDQTATGVYIFLTKPSFASLTKKAQREAVQNLLARITLSS